MRLTLGPATARTRRCRAADFPAAVPQPWWHEDSQQTGGPQPRLLRRHSAWCSGARVGPAMRRGKHPSRLPRPLCHEPNVRHPHQSQRRHWRYPTLPGSSRTRARICRRHRQSQRQSTRTSRCMSQTRLVPHHATHQVGLWHHPHRRCRRSWLRTMQPQRQPQFRPRPRSPPSRRQRPQTPHRTQCGRRQAPCLHRHRYC